jgi:hypothetical protein
MPTLGGSRRPCDHADVNGRIAVPPDRKAVYVI